MKISPLEITICRSQMTIVAAAEVGVRIKHTPTGITVHNIMYRTQHQNKLAALDLLAKS